MKMLMICCVITFFKVNMIFSQAEDPVADNKSIQDYSPSLVYYAIIYRADLGINDSIIDSLYSRAGLAETLKAENPDFNLREYEHRIVKLFLSEDQYIELLVLKNLPVAKELTSKVWEGMLKQLLISDPADSILAGRINSHFLTVLVTRDYFIEKPDEQQRYLNELDKNAPSALYKYFHHGYTKPVVKNPNRAEYAW